MSYRMVSALLASATMAGALAANAQEPLPGPRLGLSMDLTSAAIEARIEAGRFRVDAFYERNVERATRGSCAFPMAVQSLCVRLPTGGGDPDFGPFEAVAIFGPPVAALPHEAFVGAPGAEPYMAWSREEDAIGGATRRGEWLEILHQPFDCDETQCRMILPRAENEVTEGEQVLLACSISPVAAREVRAGPRACEPVALLGPADNYVRTYTGWGSARAREELGFRPGEVSSLNPVVLDALVIHAPPFELDDLIGALERAFSTVPLELDTQSWPLPRPIAVSGTAVQRNSPVIEPQVNEWVTADAITSSEEDASRIESRLRVTLTLLVNHLATSLDDYYPPSATQRGMFARELIDSVRRRVGAACGRPWTSGNRLDCTVFTNDGERR